MAEGTAGSIKAVEAISNPELKARIQHDLGRISSGYSHGEKVDFEGGAHPEGHESAGETELTDALLSVISEDVAVAHDMLAEGSADEVTAEALWSQVLTNQRGRLIERGGALDQSDSVDKDLQVHMVTLALGSVRQGNERYRHIESKNEFIDKSVVEAGLQELVENGFARSLVQVARASHGLVAVHRVEEEDFFSRKIEHVQAQGVAQLVESVVPAIELGLDKAVSTDPEEPDFAELKPEHKRARLKEADVLTVGLASTVAVQEGDPAVAAQRVDELTRRAFDVLQEYGETTDVTDFEGFTLLARVNPDLVTSDKFEADFHRLRIQRAVRNTSYRQNDHTNFRKDALIVQLWASGQRELASRMIVASQHEVGDPDHPYNGALNNTLRHIAYLQEKGGMPGFDTVAVEAELRAHVEQRVAAVKQAVEKLDQELDLTPYMPEMKHYIESLVMTANDPERALVLFDELTRGDGDRREKAGFIKDLARPAAWNDEAVFHGIERADANGVDKKYLFEIAEMAPRISHTHLLQNLDVIQKYAQAREIPEFVEVVGSDIEGKVKLIQMVDRFKGTEATSSIEEIVSSQMVQTLIREPEIRERVLLDILAHPDQWSDMRAPDELEFVAASKFMINRLSIPGTTEQPNVLLSFLRDMRLPESVRAEASRELELELIRSASAQDGTERLVTNHRKMNELIANPDLREAYLMIVEMKAQDPSIATGSIVEILKDQEILDEGTLRLLVESSDSRPAAEVIAELNKHAEVRMRWARDRVNWLRQYGKQTIAPGLLANAWANREQALADGVPDNPSDINQWAAVHAFRLYIDRRREAFPEDTDIPADDILEQHKELITELSRAYEPRKVFDALTRYIQAESQGKLRASLMDSAQVEVTIENGEELSTFEAEILDKTDPRGMTIGVDTGCCMTLDGLSKGCIWAGYEDERYGFFTLRKAGKLRAQSLMYVAQNSSGENVLVLDNIEANAGSDFGLITAAYQQALQELIQSGAFKTPISAVHLGVGYTEVDMSSLPEVQAVATPKEGTYTDAVQQRLLLKI